MNSLSHNVNETAVKHFINIHKPIGILANLQENHAPQIMHKTHEPIHKLVNHLQNINHAESDSQGGLFSLKEAMRQINEHKNGGTLTAGRLTGGGLGLYGNEDIPKTNQEMYHYLLLMSPHQLEMMREIASQILGGHHSPMWGPLIGKEDDKLEAEANDYDNIIRMPNQHAAARMLEAEHGQGGGFGKALRHVGRIASKIYKAGHSALGFVNRNKDLLMDLVPEQYQGVTTGFLETASKIDNAVNPLVDAAIDAASKSGTSKESRQKLKQLAEQSIDKAIETHLPQAKKYVDVAKDAVNTVKEYKRTNVNDMYS